MSVDFWRMGKKMLAWPVLSGFAAHSHLTVAVFTHFLHCPFSHLFHLGVSSSDRDFYYCSACTMEIWSLLQVLEVTVTQIIDTESSEEQHFRCKAGCRFLLGTFLWLLLQPCLPSWRVTPSEKDFLLPFYTWLLVDTHITPRCQLPCSSAGGVSHQKRCLQAPSFYTLLLEGLCLIRLAHKGGVLSQSLDLLQARD